MSSWETDSEDWAPSLLMQQSRCVSTRSKAIGLPAGQRGDGLQAARPCPSPLATAQRRRTRRAHAEFIDEKLQERATTNGSLRSAPPKT